MSSSKFPFRKYKESAIPQPTQPTFQANSPCGCHWMFKECRLRSLTTRQQKLELKLSPWNNCFFEDYGSVDRQSESTGSQPWVGSKPANTKSHRKKPTGMMQRIDLSTNSLIQCWDCWDCCAIGCWKCTHQILQALPVSLVFFIGSLGPRVSNRTSAQNTGIAGASAYLRVFTETLVLSEETLKVQQIALYSSLFSEACQKHSKVLQFCVQNTHKRKQCAWSQCWRPASHLEKFQQSERHAHLQARVPPLEILHLPRLDNILPNRCSKFKVEFESFPSW